MPFVVVGLYYIKSGLLFFRKHTHNKIILTILLIQPIASFDYKMIVAA
jgi:hypothetical protein